MYKDGDAENRNAKDSAAPAETEDLTAGQFSEKETEALKEAKKMKIRKVLYPIAIIAIILLWVSGLLGRE
ncbi:MAG: hypothetical protein ACOX7J_06980 [Bacillota bacterium]